MLRWQWQNKGVATTTEYEAENSRPLTLSISLIVLGVIGFIAAFALTLDKIALLENPNADLGCNISVLVIGRAHV